MWIYRGLFPDLMRTCFKFSVGIFSSVVSRFAVFGYRLLSTKIRDIVVINASVTCVAPAYSRMSNYQPEPPLKRRRVKSYHPSAKTQEEVIFGSFLTKALEYQNQIDPAETSNLSLPLQCGQKRSDHKPKKKTKFWHKSKTKKPAVYTVCDTAPEPESRLLSQSPISPEKKETPRMKLRMRKQKSKKDENSPLLPDYKEKMKMFLKEREECIDEDLQILKDSWKRNEHELAVKSDDVIEWSAFKSYTEDNIENNNSFLSIKDKNEISIHVNEEKESYYDGENSANKTAVIECSPKRKLGESGDFLDGKSDFAQVEKETLKVYRRHVKSKSDPIILPIRNPAVYATGNISPKRIGIIRPMNKVTGEEIPTISALFQGQSPEEAARIPSLDSTSVNQKNAYDSDEDIPSSICCCAIL